MMSVVVRLVAVLGFVAGLASASRAQEPSDCEWLLKYGIYDTTEYHFDRYAAGHLKTLLHSSKAETYEQFRSEAARLGIGYGIFNFNFGGKRAKTEFRAWKEELLKALDFGTLENEKIRVVVKTISPELMATVQRCLDNPPAGRLVGWLVPSKDDLTFTLHLKYKPRNAEVCKIKSVDFVSSTRKELPPPKSADFAPGAVVRATGALVPFQRKDVTEGVTVVVNTTEGAFRAEVPPGDPYAAVVQRLAQRIDALEREQAETSAALRRFAADGLFGTPVRRAVNQTHAAATDGVIIATVYGENNTRVRGVRILVGAAPGQPPTVDVANQAEPNRVNFGVYGSATGVVRKNLSYRVAALGGDGKEVAPDRDSNATAVFIPINLPALKTGE